MAAVRIQDTTTSVYFIQISVLFGVEFFIFICHAAVCCLYSFIS